MRVVHDRFQRFLASKLEARNPHLVHANTGSPHAQDCAFSASWAQSELAQRRTSLVHTKLTGCEDDNYTTLNG